MGRHRDYHGIADPVLAAEIKAMEYRPKICTCDECGADIHSADDGFYGDDYFLFPDGNSVCFDCGMEFIKSNYLIKG